jgi:hypothetical protein
LVIEVVDFNGLEVLFGVKVTLSDEEGLSEHKLFNFGIIVVHDVIINITLLLANFEEISHLLSGQLLTLVGRGFVVHHLVQLRQCFGVVLIYVKQVIHFSSRASKSFKFLSTEFCIQI